MKIVWIASIGLAALSLLATAVNAQQKTTTVALVQKLQPVPRSYPGVATDILGIRTGMTVSQAEAIAEKNYPAKPKEYKDPDTFEYKGVTVQSEPFVQRVDFISQTGDTIDTLSLLFSTPATGNTLYAMSRLLQFYRGPVSAPLVNALYPSLIKKYGPLSYNPDRDQNTIAPMIWAFTQSSRTICKSTFDCVSIFSPVQTTDLTDMGQGDWGRLQSQCGVPKVQSYVFMVSAGIYANQSDQTKADRMHVSIWDSATCMNDGKEAVKQLTAAAIKFYNSVYKPPTPKL